MGTQRHWKQHWDPTAPLVFIRRMKLGVKGAEVVYPGDKVTPAIRAALGSHPAKQNAKLRRWWDAKFLAIDGWKAPSEIQRARRARDLPRLSFEDAGGGWYLVYGRTAGEYTKLRGRAAAEAELARLKQIEADELAAGASA